MPADENEFESEGNGKTLRERLEETLRRNRELEATVLESKAEALISSKGLKHVKPQDLTGVSLPDLEKKAEELEAAKVAERASVLKEALLAVGTSEDEVEGVIAALSGQTQEQIAPLSALRQLTKVPGTPAPAVNQEQVFGRDRIEAALVAKAKGRKASA